MGQLFVRMWGDLQQSRNQAHWTCHGCPFGLPCLPGSCCASAARVCYLPSPLLLVGSLPQSLTGKQKRLRARLEVGGLLLRLRGV